MTVKRLQEHELSHVIPVHFPPFTCVFLAARLFLVALGMLLNALLDLAHLCSDAEVRRNGIAVVDVEWDAQSAADRLHGLKYVRSCPAWIGRIE
eukprot:Transcript_10123.p4 GENE.Transcript_10123~~Transcript_10123.p4  ORF type:complete len:94 (+),score=2.54 Transcript_10123:1669-1950(+)